MAIFGQSRENALFRKNAPLCSRLIVFGVDARQPSKKCQKHVVLERFILGHFGPSPPHLARSLRDLGVNAALPPKNAPLCSRLLVFLKSAPSRRRKPRKTHGSGSILKMSATLQPFACFAMVRCSEADPAPKGGPRKAHHSLVLASFCLFSLMALDVGF